MKILDFYGLPGSGKSTISHSLAMSLRKKGYSVLEPSWKLDMDTNKILRQVKKIMLSFLYYFKDKTIIKKTTEFIGNNDLNLVQKMKLYINILYTMQYVTNNKNKYDYMILDEGVIQAVVSLYMLSNNDNYKAYLEFLFSKIKIEIKPIYLFSDIEITLKRLDCRKNGNSRVDRVPKNNRKVMLKKIESICNDILKERIFINSNKNISEIIEELLKLVDKKL